MNLVKTPLTPVSLFSTAGLKVRVKETKVKETQKMFGTAFMSSVNAANLELLRV